MSNQLIVYECVVADLVAHDCKKWQAVENDLPLSKSDANFLTFKIVSFMIFVFILKTIKKSV